MMMMMMMMMMMFFKTNSSRDISTNIVGDKLQLQIEIQSQGPLRLSSSFHIQFPIKKSIKKKENNI
jgi:hypothetical protein